MYFLPFFVYFALTVGSLLAIPALLRLTWRSGLPVLGRLLLSFPVPVPFVLLSWPFVGEPALFEYECRSAGMWLGNPAADAVDDGYELLFSEGVLHRPAEHPYFRQAVQDLVEERIGFFEIAAQHVESLENRHMGPDVERYYLGDRRSRACVDDSDLQFAVGLVRSPGDLCLAVENRAAASARWTLGGFDRFGRTRDLSIVERVSGTTLARFRSSSRQAFPPLLRGASCPAEAQQANLAETLTRTAFPARARNVPDVAAPSTLPECTAPVLARIPEQHRVRTYGGAERVEVSLDAEGEDANRTRIIVNRPGRDVALHLSSYDPVVWDVSSTPETRIVAVVVAGFHGQAVVGVPASTPVLVRTTRYSPGTNCSELEYGRAQHSLYDRAPPMQPMSNQYAERTAMAIVGDADYDPTTLIRSDERSLAESAFTQ